MYPMLHVMGKSIATYGLLITIGVVLGILTSLYLSKNRGILKEDIFFTYIYGVIGLAVGGKLLYLIVNARLLWVKRTFLFSHPDVLMGILSGGFVFYGGLIGGIAMAYVYSRQFKVSFSQLMSVMLPSIPLIHAVGRLGCFAAGCCYGIPYHGPFHVIFTHSPIAPSGIPLFPVQLVESFLNLVIFLILFVYAKKERSSQFLAGVYLILYSVMRFNLEYLRGDTERGFQLLFSTSQWISLGLLSVGVWLITKKRHI